jgi:peptidoglycan-associated lipoprotein
MSKRVVVVSLVICLVAFLFLGCHRSVVIEGGAEDTEQPEVMEEQPQTPGEAEAGLQQEDIEASLQTKQYPGIEGQVFESSMLGDIYFAFDRHDLGPEARAVLTKNAEFVLDFPEAEIQIEGHCDERGTSEYNLALGERRSLSVRQYLVSLGVPADRLSTISFGEELPADPRHNEAAWAKNRRAHFVILSK